MKGQVQDKAIQTFGEGEYFYAKNIVLSDKQGSIANEEGNLLHSNIGDGKTVIGTINVANSIVVFWVQGGSRGLGIIDERGYTPVADPLGIISSISLSKNYPVVAKHFIKNNGEVVIAFVADNIKPRIVNIGTLINPKVTDADDVKDTLLFPEANVAQTVSSIVTGSGSLISGVYYLTYAYANVDTETSFFNINNPISIQDELSGYDGIVSSITTNKAIQIQFSNIDTSYQYIQLGYIYKDSQSIKAYKSSKYLITGTTMFLLLTGTENNEEVTLEELTVPNIQYTRVKDLAVLNDRLYVANLKTRSDIDYQQYANNILIDYKYDLVDLTDNEKLSQANRDNTGFLHSEVYAFYIRFWFDDSTISKWFHIPGRPYVAGDSTGTTSVGDISKSRWHYMSNFDVVGASTNMGYYENNNELYPTEGDFPNSGASPSEVTRVRHHRFPSLKHIRDKVIATGDAGDIAAYGVTKTSVLGIDVTNVLSIPTDALYWEIGYAKRDYNNATTYGVGLTNYAAFPKEVDNNTSITVKDTRVWSAGVNYNILEQNDDILNQDRWFVDYNYGYTRVIIPPSTTPNPVAGNTYKYVRFNTMDTLINTPQLSNAYVHMEYLLSVAPIGTSAWQQFSEAGNNPSGLIHHRRRVVIDYTTGSVTSLTGEKMIAVENYEYLSTNSVGAGNGSIEYFNIDNEATLLLQAYTGTDFTEAVDSSPVPTVGNGDTTNVLSTNVGTNALFTSKAYVMTLKSSRENCYLEFYNQTVVSTGKLNTTDNTTMRGGDGFIGDYSFITTAQNNPFSIQDGLASGIRAVHRYLTESSLNINLRYEIGTNYYSKYFPKSDYRQVDTLFDIGSNYPLGIEPNQTSYNIESGSVNDLKQTIINYPLQEFDNNFPYRIARSQVQQRETNLINWKKFASQDYYESVRDRGEIVSIEGYLPKFIIHHERGLFITKDRVKLPTDAGEVQIGTGDIFELDPTEVITTEGGYAGTQNKLCIDLNKLGYCFIDVLQGKVFIFNDSLNEISNTGMRNFFRDYLPMYQTTFTNDTTTLTATYNTKKNITTIPKVIIENSLEGKVYKDVIVPVNYTNAYGEDYYYREGNHSGNVAVNLIVRSTIREIGDNPYDGYGYSVCYDEKWNRLILNKLRECYFTSGTESTITRIRYVNTITKTIFTNTATRTLSGTSVTIIDQITINYFGTDLTQIRFSGGASLDNFESFTITGGGLPGTYIVLSGLSDIDYILVGLFPDIGLIGGIYEVTPTTTQYYNGTTWQNTATTWITYGIVADPVPTNTFQTSDGGVLNYFNKDLEWQTVLFQYITYNSNAQDEAVGGEYSPIYTEISNSIEYYNGTGWQSGIVSIPLAPVKDCTTPYVSGIIQGSYTTNLATKLQEGDIVIQSGVYREYVNGSLQNLTNKDSWTYSYSPQSNMWISSHSYKPNKIISSYNKLYTIVKNNVYLHNLTNNTSFYGISESAYIDIVFNFGKKVIFTGVSWNSTTEDIANIKQYNDTIDYITVRNDNQITKRIEIEPLVNTRRVYDEWYYNGIRDSNVYNKQIIRDILNEFKIDLSNVKDKRSYDRGRFITDAVICRLEITSDNKVYIHSISPIAKEIYR
jgi:hypothetical protein